MGDFTKEIDGDKLFLRIAFVCSGLEPGRNGVGDYTRRLADELKRRGHSVALLALNDRNLIHREQQEANEFRLSNRVPWQEKIHLANSFLNDIRPKFLSLQFVAHGFNPRGVPFGLAGRLSNLGRGVPWHVMFHELWIEPIGGWRNLFVSAYQKNLARSIYRKLRPVSVHSSNAFYAQRLSLSGIPCSELPLFSNIPVVPHAGPSRPKEWVFAFFGSLRHGWEPEPLLSKIESARLAAGKKVCRFISIGHLGEHGEWLWNRMISSGYASFHFEKLGEMDPHRISRALQEADFGVAISPSHLLGKSGAVAAMREHGLPIIVNRFNKVDRDSLRFSNPPFILLDSSFEENLRLAKSAPCVETLPHVAEIFLNSLGGGK